MKAMQRTQRDEETSKSAKDAGLPDTHLPVLYDPPARVQGKAAGELRGTIVQAARELGDVEWGGVPDGHVTGMRVRIPRHRLWVNPLCSIDYDEDALTEMAGSLRVKGQLAPLCVTPARDPRPMDIDGTGGEYLVLDGALRLKASRKSGRADLEDLECLVRLHTNAYGATLDGVVMKASQRPLTDEQAGSLLRRLRTIYDETKKRVATLEPWPKQQEWARILGRSQSTISKWLAIAQMHPVVVQLVDDGRMSESTAVELQPLSRAEQAQMAVQLEDERQREGSDTIPRAHARTVVQAQRKGHTQWVDATLARVPVEQLLLPGLAEYDPPVTIAILAHDLTAALDTALDGLDRPHPALERLHKALRSPEIMAFVEQIRGTLLEE